MGLGVSALARCLSERFDARLVLERHDENPFLERFYHYSSRWAFQAQIAFLANRYWQQRTMQPLGLFHRGMVADYTSDKDRVFAQLNLRGEDLKLYEELYEQMEPATPRPDLVVLVRGSVRRSMEAIRERGQSYEVGIDEGYIVALHEAYMEYFLRHGRSPVIIIDSDRMNCVDNAQHFEELVLQVCRPDHFGVTYLRPIQSDLFS